MAGDDGPMTFDALTAVYRAETNSTQLSSVKKDFYTAAQELIAAQSRECDRLEKEDPDSFIYEGAVQRKKKILYHLRMIVECRMNKIGGMAMRGAMGANNMIDNLTPEEKEYYNSILEASKQFWKLSERKKKVFVSKDITEIAEPEPPKAAEEKKTAVVDDVPLSEIPFDDFPEDMPVQETVPEETADENAEEDPAAATEEIPEEEEGTSVPAETVQETSEEVKEPEIPAQIPQEPVPSIPEVMEETIVIRILEDLPPFSGPEVNYSLKKEDVVRMPAVMAKALINRGMARIVSTA